VGSTFEYVVEVTDDARVEALTNILTLKVISKNVRSGGTGLRTETGNRGKGNLGSSAQLALPPIVPVSEKGWEKHGFDESTALKIKHAESADGGDASDVYDFYVNVDNRYLKITQKETKTDPGLLEKQFIYGMVLVGLALLQEQKEQMKHATVGSDDEHYAEESIEKRVTLVTKALAPIFLPMVDAIGGLSMDDEN